MKKKLAVFDAADYLDNETVIAEYLNAALEDGNPDVLLTAIADVAKGSDPWLDQDAAQQLVWAAETLRGEIEPADGPVAQELNRLKDRLPRRVRDPNDVRFIGEHLNDRFQRLYGFEPAEFREAFAKIAGLVK